MNYGKFGRCEATAKTTGERCGRPAVGEHGKCDKHGGASTGPRDPSKLEGNDHAVGNPGGGAPEGNTNAATYGAWCDWRKQYDRLEGEAKARVDEAIEAELECTKAPLPDAVLEEKARELSMLRFLWERAQIQIFDQGIGIERERELEVIGDNGETETVTVTETAVNPGLKADLRHSKRMRELRHELRVFYTPDGRPWTARRDTRSEWHIDDEGNWVPTTIRAANINLESKLRDEEIAEQYAEDDN